MNAVFQMDSGVAFQLPPLGLSLVLAGFLGRPAPFCAGKAGISSCFGRRADEGTSLRPAPFLAHAPEATQQKDHGAGRSGDARGVRALGMRSVYLTCSACGYASTFNVNDWQDDVFITSFSPYARCAKCGHLGANVRPDWTQLRGMPETRRKG